MTIDLKLARLVGMLPQGAVREACLTLNDDMTWSVMVGGHKFVHIGEWGGDFYVEGVTADEAIDACAQQMQQKSK